MPYRDPVSTSPPAGVRADGPTVTSAGVRLHLPRHVAQLDGVRIDLDWPLAIGAEFAPDGAGGWQLNIPRPPVDRFEYQLVLRSDGQETRGLDPTNPLQVAGPFGGRSEIRFPEYRMPQWISTRITGSTVRVQDPPGRLGAPVPIQLFTPASVATDQATPLLIVQDGSDFADRGMLLAWACASARPLRVALLDPAPGFRTAWYAADTGYADHIATAVLPAIRASVPVTSVVGVGASLGGLITLVIHRRHPHALDGLVLQSGSFFRPELDGQEAHWPEFRQVCAAVDEITAAGPADVRAVPVLLTVGAVEENRANNERMAGALALQGYPLTARLVPDAHTVIGWRDAWTPGMNELVALMP